MAKKTAAKKAAAKQVPGKKKTAAKKSPARKADPITLDAAEEKAFDLAQSSTKVCKELEVAVTEAATAAVRKVFKGHRVPLSRVQAGTLTMVLFGD